MRGCMVIQLRACMIMSTPPMPSDRRPNFNLWNVIFNQDILENTISGIFFFCCCPDLHEICESCYCRGIKVIVTPNSVSELLSNPSNTYVCV